MGTVQLLPVRFFVDDLSLSLSPLLIIGLGQVTNFFLDIINFIQFKFEKNIKRAKATITQ